MASNPNNSGGMEAVTSSSPKARGIKDVSANRVMTIKGPKSSVAKGSLSPRTSAPIVNGK